tara:strand:+ start:786 stop:965 length:180 start_codon:yes stop_codon:yes gene_type:complete
MKTATLEILEPGAVILGSFTNGQYFVREYVDGEEMGGCFFKTEQEAKNHIKEYTKKHTE